MREITIAQAVNEALAEELRRDETVFVIGEDVAEAGTPFKVLSGLVEEFGPERILDSPISEAGITGLGVGAAMTGMRPVVDIMFGDFLTLVMDQLANQAAKAHYMSGGKLRVPLVLRTTLGATRRSAAQHSQSLQAWVAHVPGLKVVLPSTPYDAKGLLKSAIRDDNPVVFIEDKMDWRVTGEVPDGGVHAAVRRRRREARRRGRDARRHELDGPRLPRRRPSCWQRTGSRPRWSTRARSRRSTPATLVDSAAKTGRAIVVDEGHRSYGVTAELAAVIAEGAFHHLDAPVRRLGALDVPVPFSPTLEDETVPTAELVAATARELCGRA